MTMNAAARGQRQPLPWRRRHAQKSAARQQAAPVPVWVVNKPDELVAGLLHGLHLALLSGPRMIRAVLSRNNVEALGRLEFSGSLLPDGLLLLAGSFAAAMAARALDIDQDDPVAGLRKVDLLIKHFASGSIQTWLAFAAPALLLLWVSIGAGKVLLARRFPEHAHDGGRLMLASVSAVSVLVALCFTSAWVINMILAASVSDLRLGASATHLDPEVQGLLSAMVRTLLVSAGLAPLLIPFVGYRFAQQASASTSRWGRAIDRFVVAPVIFSLVPVLPLMLYGSSESIVDALPAILNFEKADRTDLIIPGHAPQCYALGEKVVCQMLVKSSAPQPYALSPIRLVKIDFLDSHGEVISDAAFKDKEVEQLYPAAGASQMWRLDAGQVATLVVSFPRAAVCKEVRAASRKGGGSRIVEFDLRVATGPAYQLTTEGKFAFPIVIFYGRSANQDMTEFFQSADSVIVSRFHKDICPPSEGQAERKK